MKLNLMAKELFYIRRAAGVWLVAALTSFISVPTWLYGCVFLAVLATVVLLPKNR